MRKLRPRAGKCGAWIQPRQSGLRVSVYWPRAASLAVNSWELWQENLFGKMGNEGRITPNVDTYDFNIIWCRTFSRFHYDFSLELAVSLVSSEPGWLLLLTRVRNRMEMKLFTAFLSLQSIFFSAKLQEITVCLKPQQVEKAFWWNNNECVSVDPSSAAHSVLTLWPLSASVSSSAYSG